MPLPPPPLDANGKVTRYNCTAIPCDAVIIRRVSSLQVVNDAKSPSGKRLSSAVFKESSPKGSGKSVDLEMLIEEAGLNPRAFVTTPRWIGSICYLAQSLRDLGFDIGSHPITGEFENPYHGEVWGDFSSAQIKRMPRLASWYVEITGVDICVGEG